MSSSLVITGLGTVGAWGAGGEALAAALESGRPELSQVDRQAGYHRSRSPTLAALAHEVELSPWLSARQARRMSSPSKFAVAAARMALEDAGLRGEGTDGRIAVILATAFGTARFAEELVREILSQGPGAASPFHFSESVANAPAAQVAMACGARGANVAVTQREAGPVLSLVLAARELQARRCRFALAGATDEINPLVHASLGRFRALARPGPGGTEAARPFDRRRDGFLAAEGSSVVVLEAEESAQRRGARPLARLVGWVRAFDPSAPTYGWGSGAEPLADAVRRGLERFDLTPAHVDLVVSTASGSRSGDRLEAGVLRRLFADARLPAVAAPKGVTGEYGGGQLGAAVLAAQGRGLGPTAGFSEPDPALGIRPLERAPEAPPRRVLVSALAAGGSAAWLVLERP